MGCWVSKTGCNVDSLLDWDSFTCTVDCKRGLDGFWRIMF
jgi:hypothetical protein